MDYNSWLHFAHLTLKASLKIADDNEAMILLSEVIHQDFSYIYQHLQTQLEPAEENLLNSFLTRRINREPIAYIIGKSYFWDLILEVSKDTLIPRPDTELLVEMILDKIKNIHQAKILDLGTGTGAIALSVASNLRDPAMEITGVDFKESIIALAKRNAISNELDKYVSFIHSDWFSAIHSKYDLIVANPPYIAENDTHLTQLTYEPISALVSANNGYAALQHIITTSPQFLSSLSYLVVEHGFSQGEEVRKIFLNSGFCEVYTISDYGRNPRVTIGTWKEN